MEGISFVENERNSGDEMEALCLENPDSALEKALEYVRFAREADLSRAESSACARIICRFLLCKKIKSRLMQYLLENEELTKAVFGELNTYKYSLVFLLKRILRLNNPEFTGKVIRWLTANPWCEEGAKPWSDRLSSGFVVEEALKAPEDYLLLTDENRAAIINNSGSLQLPFRE